MRAPARLCARPPPSYARHPLRPVPRLINQTSRPALLIAVQSALPSQGAATIALFDWIASVRSSMDVTLSVDPLDAPGYAVLRRACARTGVPVLCIAPTTGPRLAPVLDQVAAPLASQAWNCVEILWAGSAASPPYRLPSPWPQQTVLAVSLHADPPPGAAWLDAADLVFCRSQDQADRLAIDPARCRVALDPAAKADLLHAASHAKQQPRPHAWPPRRLLQVTPMSSAPYVHTLRRAVQAAAGSERTCPILACGPAPSRPGEGVTHLPGDLAAPDSFDPAVFDAVLDQADIVHVHQCLTRFGLFVAARARMLGRPVIGTDHGGGQAPFLNAQPYLMGLFGVIQTYSAYGDLCTYNLPVQRERIPGPVDDTLFTLAAETGRDSALVVSTGAILPNQGFESLIDALPPTRRLVIAGPKPDPAYHDHLRQRAGGHDVTFEPELDDAALLALLHGAGLCVQPAIHTGPLGQTIAKPDLLGLRALQALCTGLPTIVSAVGALNELGGLPGCFVAHTPAELATLLDDHAHGRLPTVPAQAIRAAVSARYGLAAFGTHYLAMVDGLAPCTS